MVGGGVLGGGGGGSADDGRTNGYLAIEWGAPALVTWTICRTTPCW